MKHITWVSLLTATAIIVSPVLISCGGETETKYITQTETEYIVTTYTKSVTFSSEDTADGVRITLASETQGAAIYYTLDNSAPTTKSTKYAAPFEVKKDTTIKAVAVKEGFENSPVSVAEIKIRESAQEASENVGEHESTTLFTFVTAQIGMAEDIAPLTFSPKGNMFTAEEGFASYTWYVDGTKQDCTENVFAYAQKEAGTYAILLLVKKSAGDSNIYSATATLTIE